MRTKSQTFDIFQKLISQADRQSGKKFKHLRTDFERKFANGALWKYKSKESVYWHPSTLSTLE